ncbi:MAG TPA: hypothetical protein VFD92_08575 [Candidatus Binatia bacterium]|nr:hypothetical protein [Candidatus Binatia bacterium]
MKRMIRAGSVVVAAGVALIGGASLSMKSATAQTTPTFDHLKCYGIRDGLRQNLYTATLVPLDGSVFTTENGDPSSGSPAGCRIQIPAAEFCTAVSKQDAHTVKGGTPPPGTGPGPDAGEYFCYRLRCPGDRTREQFTATDQFGTRTVQLNDRPTKLCAPAFRGAVPTGTPTASGTPSGTPTPTGGPTATPTATPTVEPTATGTAEPTPTPTAEPTATPTAGSASRAFLDAPESLF